MSTDEVPGLAPASEVADLVERARQGDQDAWDGLVDRFLPLVTSIIGGFRLQGADASDVNQSVWLRLVENLGRLREPKALPGWLATTTRREALRLIAARNRTRPADPAWRMLDTPTDDGAAELVETSLRAQALRDALLELPPRRRELMELLLRDPPPPYEEIGRLLGIPVGSIGPTRARVLAQLRNSHALRPYRGAGTEENGGDRDVALG